MAKAELIEISSGVWEKRGVSTRLTKDGPVIQHSVRVDLSQLTPEQQASLILNSCTIKVQTQLRNLDRKEFLKHDGITVMFDPISERRTGTIRPSKAANVLLESELEALDSDMLEALLKRLDVEKKKREA